MLYLVFIRTIKGQPFEQQQQQQHCEKFLTEWLRSQSTAGVLLDGYCN